MTVQLSAKENRTRDKTVQSAWRENPWNKSVCLAGESVEIADLETGVNPKLQAALAMSMR
jgi:hypothetical protein